MMKRKAPIVFALALLAFLSSAFASVIIHVDAKPFPDWPDMPSWISVTHAHGHYEEGVSVLDYSEREDYDTTAQDEPYDVNLEDSDDGYSWDTYNL